MFNLTLKLSENIGKTISLIGSVSPTPWQHLIEIKETYENIEYLDLEDGNQIVVYSRKSIKCEGRIKITGKVIEVAGRSKRPGDTSESVYSEYQIVVDDWECFN